MVASGSLHTKVLEASRHCKFWVMHQLNSKIFKLICCRYYSCWLDVLIFFVVLLIEQHLLTDINYIYSLCIAKLYSLPDLKIDLPKVELLYQILISLQEGIFSLIYLTYLFLSSSEKESGKAKTREELLAEERDYKRRRQSYRGKKVKRNPTEVDPEFVKNVCCSY
jgi:hypothetical protein